MQLSRWQRLTALSFVFLAVLLLSLFGASGVAHAAGSTCYATRDDGTTLFSSSDAHAVQQAVDAASAGDHVKVAGRCVGVGRWGTRPSRSTFP
ncbi:MAG: hypothetical protein HC802_22805 [Caldilineaceae bacterium]|nr:hypothetical protein [Caldilineaceae bacterium]